MDLMEALAGLESSNDLHEGRLMMLLLAFAGDEGKGQIEGLTKLAKLDFLLRYPVFLQRALQKKGSSTKAVKLQAYEEASVESKMVRYRFGPWDHRYRQFLNLLIGKDLVKIEIDGRTVKIGLTQTGLVHARSLSESDYYEDMARRARVLKTHFDMTGTNLMKFIYRTFPEILSLRANELISP